MQCWASLEADEGTRTLDNDPPRTPATMSVFGIRGHWDSHRCAARFWIVWGMNGTADPLGVFFVVPSGDGR